MDRGTLGKKPKAGENRIPPLMNGGYVDASFLSEWVVRLPTGTGRILP